MSKHSSCPFCGSKENQTATDDGIGWVKCNGCGATGPIFSKYSGEEDREYVSWESRAEAQALREELKNRTAECNGLHEMLRQEHDRTEKAREEVAAYEDGIRSLACQLGAGGFNAEQLTAAQLVDKVKWGVNNIAETQGRLLDEVRAERDALRARVVVFPDFDNDVIIDTFRRNGFRIELGETYSVKGQIAQLLNALGELARLNGKAVSEGLLRSACSSITRLILSAQTRPSCQKGMVDPCRCHRCNVDRALKVDAELRALLGEGKEVGNVLVRK